jgi:baculoviral IAP repeat-containing protein 2/3
MVIMNIENNRLRTFEGWPANAAVEPQRIAKAGFFYTGRGLEVQCFSCGGKISEWNYGDQVMARHRALDPQCPFVKSPTQSGNVPIIPGDTPQPSTSSSEADGERPSSSTVGDSGTWDQGMMYRSEAARLESFRSWPISFIVAPERLAKAGFYYLQQGDKVCSLTVTAPLQQLGFLYINKRSLLYFILNQLNPHHTFSIHISKIHSSIFLPFTWSWNWFLCSFEDLW